MKKYLLPVFVLWAALLPVLNATAQDDIQWPITDATYQITVGQQVKTEADLVDGGLYVIHQPRNNSCIEEGADDQKLYINGLSYSGLNGSTSTTYVMKLLKQTDGTWQIQTCTGHYFPVPTGNGNLYSSDVPGNYTLNFNSNGYIFPRIDVDGTLYALDRASSGVYSYTSVNSTEGSAQCYQIYPVTLGEEQAPEEIEEFVAYQIVNANGRGMLYYSPSNSSDFVWSTGKNDTNAPAENYQWVFVKTANGDYNLYNIGRRAFIEPSSELGNYQTTATDSYTPKMTWVFTGNKVGITLDQLTSTNYAIHTTNPQVYMSVSNTFNGPIISYYAATDAGVPFYFVKGEPVSDEVKEEIINGITTLSERDITVGQGYQTVGRNNERDVLLRIGISGNIAANIDRLGITLKGNTRKNIVSLGLYQTNNPEFYADENPTELFSVEPLKDQITLPVDYTLTTGTNYLWLTAHISPNAKLTDVVDAALTQVEYTFEGEQKSIDVAETTGDPAGEARIFDVQSIVVAPTTMGSRFYRIPALTTAPDGSLIAACDKRYSSNADIGGGHVIDIVVLRSTDGGKTWSEPVTVAKGDNSSNATCGYGDPSLTVGADGTIYCLFAAGNTGFFSGLNRICMVTSTDNGLTWSPVQVIAPASDTSAGLTFTDKAGLYDYFVTSGKGLCTTDGVLMYLLDAQTASGGTETNFLLYSTDGKNWVVDNHTVCTGANEAKLIQMNDGSLLSSTRTGGARIFNTATYTNNGDGTCSFSWGAQKKDTQMNAASCNADLIYYSRETDGQADVILHSYLNSGSRENLTLAASLDQGATWQSFLNIQPGGAAYSTMTVLENGDLGVFFEDESYSAGNGYAQTYVTITSEQIKAFVKAQSPEDEQANYERALAQLEDGGVYYFATSYRADEETGSKRYLKADGTLTDNYQEAKFFTFQETPLDGGYKPYGWKSGQFTNPTNATTNTSYIRTDWQNRDDWEAQVILQDEDGHYAIRCTNAGTEATWGSNAYWTTDDEGNATYDLGGGKHYIWEIEKVGVTPVFDASQTYRIITAANEYMQKAEGANTVIAYQRDQASDFYIVPVSNLPGSFTLQDKETGLYLNAATQMQDCTLSTTATQCRIQHIVNVNMVNNYNILGPFSTGYAYISPTYLDNGDVFAHVECNEDADQLLRYWRIVPTEEDIAVGISEQPTTGGQPSAVFNISGQRQQQLQRGLNIVRKTDGTVVKTIRK